MGNRNFREMLENQWSRGNFVCVGLDSEFGKIPNCCHHPDLDFPETNVGVCEWLTICDFNHAIVEATKDLVCAYKPNVAFYEAYGAEGIATLHRTIADIHTIAPDVPVILDAKRADIGNTNVGYVEMAFDFLKADAITVNPYLGAEALQPFLSQKEKGIFVLCRTSNPGAHEFQDIDMTVDFDEANFLNAKKCSWRVSADGYHAKLYEHVAYRVSQFWNKNNNCALVVGATYPGELRGVRKVVGDMPILIPGIGAQGGKVEEIVPAGRDSRKRGIIVNSSRGIIYASKEADFASAARRKTEELRDEINRCLALESP